MNHSLTHVHFFLVLANRLTVAVSDVLNPNIDDMSRGVGPLGYGTTQGDFSPQVSLRSACFCVGFWQKKRVQENLLMTTPIASLSYHFA